MRTYPIVAFLVLLAAGACGSSPTEPTPHEGAGGTGGSGAGGTGGEEIPTPESVCRLWAEGHVENERVPWVPGEDVCDPGTLGEVAIEDTIRRINLFRALSGLPPVTEDRARHPMTQACAVMMNVNGALSHDPPVSWECWTAQGAAGAASSNLALGSTTPGNAIDLLMRDPGVESVGHRRWLLGYFLGKVAIGFAGRATCVRVFDDSGQTDREWTAYPPPGPAPIDMVTDPWDRPIPWSFHPADGIEGAEVTMQKLPEGEPVAIDSWIPDTGFQIPDAIVWQPPPVQAGESYRITITRPSKATVTYDVELVDCDALDP